MACNLECSDVDALDLLRLQLMSWNGPAVGDGWNTCPDPPVAAHRHPSPLSHPLGV